MTKQPLTSQVRIILKQLLHLSFIALILLVWRKKASSL